MLELSKAIVLLRDPHALCLCRLARDDSLLELRDLLLVAGLEIAEHAVGDPVISG
jgi:hypothetical protein